MPKMKTKSSAKSVLGRRQPAKVRGSFAFKQHNLRKRSQKMKRQARGTRIFSEADSPDYQILYALQSE